MSEKLKIARMTIHMGQKEIAKILGMAITSYNEKENGKREFTVSEAKKLMELFDKKFEDLF